MMFFWMMEGMDLFRGQVGIFKMTKGMGIVQGTSEMVHDMGLK